MTSNKYTPESTEFIKSLRLKKGAHGNPEKGMCMMEAVAFVAGEEHSDRPHCVSPVIGSFLRALNDNLSDKNRKILKTYIPKVIGTNTGPKDDIKRGVIAANWLVRVLLPELLDLAKLHSHAEKLRSLPKFESFGDLSRARADIAAAADAANAAAYAVHAAVYAAADAAVYAAAYAAAAAARADAAANAAAAADARARAADADADADAAVYAAADAAVYAAARAAADAAVYAAAAGYFQNSALAMLDEMIAVGVKNA